eukprot:1632065-Amphidinium_carterae.1
MMNHQNKCAHASKIKLITYQPSFQNDLLHYRRLIANFQFHKPTWLPTDNLSILLQCFIANLINDLRFFRASLAARTLPMVVIPALRSEGLRSNSKDYTNGQPWLDFSC